MEEMLINERFKSPNKEFEKVYSLFRKKDYFSEKSQVKRKQEEFVRFLKKGDPMATKVFKQNKENMKSSLSFIEDMVMDYNKKNAFQDFQVFSTAVNDIEMKDSKSAPKSADSIKRKIHNNSQKYTMALYSAIRKQKFNNYKDVHKDVDELISKNEGFSSDAQRKAAFANGYEEKGKKKNESVNEGISVSDERHFGKKGIIIMIDDNGKKVSAIFKDKKNADKFNRNKPSDIKKLLQLAKKTKYPKAIDESVINEWGSSDQSTFNKSIHKDIGSPKKMPSPFDDKLRAAAEDAVDFYWEDWPEYQTDRDGLIDDAVRGYLRRYFKQDFQMMQRMVGGTGMNKEQAEWYEKNRGKKQYKLSTPPTQNSNWMNDAYK